MPGKTKHPETAPGLYGRLRAWLSTPTDGASLAAFRIAYGLVMAWHVGSYLVPHGGVRKLDYYYVDPAWNFTYLGFGWVRPWAEPWLTAHFAFAVVAALLVAAGLFYRYAAVALFLSYTYFFLLEAANYNNHYYLMCLLALLLATMPAARRFSLDSFLAARRAARDGGATPPPEKTIPLWPVLLLRAQIFLMYFYGGVAKLNADWLTGEPLLAPGATLHAFLSSRLGLPAWVEVSHLCLFLAWGGLVYDLSVGLLLLWGRTRWLAIGLTFVFHLHNHFIFPIGVFPTLAFAATLIFFPTDWPVRAYRWLRSKAGHAVAAPATAPAPAARLISPRAVALVCCFVAWQAVWPLRHFAIPGDANWTEEAQDFSWRMMLRAKAAGCLLYRVDDPALMVVDERGREQIDWAACPDGTPRAVYASIDSHAFRWDHHPGLSMTYEPTLGTRVLYSLTDVQAATDGGTDAARAEITRQWRDAFGREPLIEEALTLAEALEAVRTQAGGEEARRRHSAETLTLVDAALDQLDATFSPSDDSARPSESQQVALASGLHTLYQSPVFQPTLARLSPFAIQGAEHADRRFLVVRDKDPAQQPDAESLLALSGGEPYLVWADLSRLRPVDWRGLPQTLVGFEDRRLRVLWNHFHELHTQQLEKFAVRPFLIRQYARHIADRWEEAVGRRPAVQAVSYIMLNYHLPRPLVDPQTDLASVSYSTLRHNDWILPRSTERIRVADRLRDRGESSR